MQPKKTKTKTKTQPNKKNPKNPPPKKKPPQTPKQNKNPKKRIFKKKKHAKNKQPPPLGIAVQPLRTSRTWRSRLPLRPGRGGAVPGAVPEPSPGHGGEGGPGRGAATALLISPAVGRGGSAGSGRHAAVLGKAPGRGDASMAGGRLRPGPRHGTAGRRGRCPAEGRRAQCPAPRGPLSLSGQLVGPVTGAAVPGVGSPAAPHPRPASLLPPSSHPSPFFLQNGALKPLCKWSSAACFSSKLCS